MTECQVCHTPAEDAQIRIQEGSVDLRHRSICIDPGGGLIYLHNEPLQQRETQY